MHKVVRLRSKGPVPAKQRYISRKTNSFPLCTVRSDTICLMASPYRDRTAEFRSLSQTLKKIGGATTAVDQPNNSFVSPKPPNPASSRSEFNKKASRIGLGIHEASQKIARLAKCKPFLSLFFF